MAAEVGIEPTTTRLTAGSSASELLRIVSRPIRKRLIASNASTSVVELATWGGVKHRGEGLVKRGCKSYHLKRSMTAGSLRHISPVLVRVATCYRSRETLPEPA